MTGCRQDAPATLLRAAWLAHPGPAEDAKVPAEAGEVGAASGALLPPGGTGLLDALAAAAPDPAQVTHALTVFAWERASTTGDLSCAMAELAELWELLEPSKTALIPHELARHRLVDAWVDAVAAERGSPCIDPLSGLHTAGFLYGRVAELDRQSGDDPTPLMLLVVRWVAPTGPWARIAQTLDVASALRARVRPEATLSQIGSTMAVALVPDDARARQERISLTKAIEASELSSAHVQVDVYAVPDSRSRLPELVTRLHEAATVDLATEPLSLRHPGTGPLEGGG